MVRCKSMENKIVKQQFKLSITQILLISTDSTLRNS